MTKVASESIKKANSYSLDNIDSELGQKRSNDQSMNMEEITKYYPTRVSRSDNLWSVNKLPWKVPSSRALYVLLASRSTKYHIAISAASSSGASKQRLHSGHDNKYFLFEDVSDAVLFCMIFYYYDEDARVIASNPNHYDALPDFPQELPEVYLTEYVDMVYSTVHNNPEPCSSKDDYQF